MKKLYKTPQLIIVNVQLQKMMAGSPYGKNIKGDASSEYDVLSRRGRGNDIWDDEDDED